ncbi:MAG: Alpha-2,8-polysialyltransferase [Verrucomicrobiota bacterium]
MNARGAKLWIVMGRPTRLPGALIAVQSLGEHFPGGCHLLRDDSEWWQRTDWKRFEKYFAAVHTFGRVRKGRGIVDLARLYRDTSGRKAQVATLPIDSENDVVICLASVTGIANAVASAHPRVRKILCISHSDYDRLHQTPDRLRFRFTTSGWLQNRLIEPLTGLERTLHLKPRINPGGDGVRLVRLEKRPEEIYQPIVVMSNSGSERPNEGVIAARFPSIAELPETLLQSVQDRHRRVVFFGTPFLLIHNLPPDEYVQHLNRCLDYIRRHYPGRDLIYRPHPIETREATQLNLAGFRLEDDREPAELYFLRHFSNIDAVYSVSSTVSRVALNNGINAYAFWRAFPFNEIAAKFFEKTMGDVPPQFDIVDLARSPVPYQQNLSRDANTRNFGDAVKVAIETTMSI